MNQESFDAFIQRAKTDEVHHSLRKEAENIVNDLERQIDVAQIRKRVQENDLTEKIERSLRERNKTDFMRYTTEWNTLQEKTSFV